jgi:hypothetical protein
MESILDNLQNNISPELFDFYNKSFMVNGDPNIENILPSTNLNTSGEDDIKKLATKINNDNKLFQDRVTNLQGSFNDPFKEVKMYGFNPSFKGLNMDRYDDKELGFDPFRDNEKFYNENTSIFYDYGRAFNGMGRLAAGAFVDSATSLGRMIQGDFDVSPEFALDSERIMAETMSTKSGFLPGVANFMVNTGFTVGMLAEMVVEEGLIAGASLLLAPGSGGASLTGGAYLAALRAQMGATRIASAWKGMGALRKALTNLDDVNEARRYFTQFGKGTVDFLNPLRNTTDLFVGGNKLKGLGQMAAVSKGFGAFFRDVRDINRSLSEARLEGGFVQNKMFEDLVNEHIERTGQDPTESELQGIRNMAHTAGMTTQLINLPVIHYTNNIVFGNLSRPLTKFIGGANDIRFLKGKFGWVGDTFQELDKGLIQSTRRSLNPRNISRNSLNYFSANLAEGLQEVFQEATAVATEDYYKNLYFNENSIARKMNELSWLDSYGKGVGAQMSGQGLEVFASGFFMGGLMNTVSKNLFKTIDYVHESVNDRRLEARAKKDPEFKIEYEKQKADKQQRITQAKKDLVEGINALYQDPNKLFAPDLENLTAQEILDRKIRAAGANNDRKFLIDFTDESFFKHVETALRVGKFESLIDRIEGRLKLNDDELAQAMSVKDGAAARARLEVSIDRAKEIKRRFDLAPKNPIDLSKFNSSFFNKNKATEEEYYQARIYSKAFDDAVNDMIFSQASFDRKLERMRNITGDFAKIDILANAPAAPLMHLFGASNMMTEIELLMSEIQALDPTDEKNKKTIEEKTSLLNKLNTLAETIDDFTEYDRKTRTNEELDNDDIQDPKYAEAIREAFGEYMEEYAKVNKTYIKADNLDNAFDLLYDYYRLDVDADRLSKSVAVVSSPSFINDEASRKFRALKNTYDNRKSYIQKSVDKFFELIGLNDVFSKLKDLDVAVHPQEALAFNLAQGNYKIKRFVNAKTLEEIKESDPLMEKIKNIMSDYEQTIGIKEKEEAKAKAEEGKKKEEEAKKEAEEEKKAAQKVETDVLAGLDSKTIKELKDAYNDIERDDKESFEEFLDSPQAQRIIAAAKRGKEPEEKPGEQPPQVSIDAKEKLKQIWNSIGNGPGRNALEEGWAESFGYLAETLDVGGNNYQAHGMGKSGFPAALRDLFELFDKGIDSSRGGGQLYTAPLAISEENKAAASAIGTSGGTAYTDGAFVLVAKKGIVSIKSIDDIAGILVNSGLTDINPEIVTELRKVFPNLIIENYKNAKSLVEQLNARTTTPISTDTNLGFENLGNIGNQGLAIMEDDVLKKGKHVISDISRATPEQRQKIDSNIEQIKAKYPEKNITSKIEGNTLIIQATPVSTDTKAEIERLINETGKAVVNGLEVKPTFDSNRNRIFVVYVPRKGNNFTTYPFNTLDDAINFANNKPNSEKEQSEFAAILKAGGKIKFLQQEKDKAILTITNFRDNAQIIIDFLGERFQSKYQDTRSRDIQKQELIDKINAKYDAELAALEGKETKVETNLSANIDPPNEGVEEELTPEEVEILDDLKPKSPFSELDPLYSGDEFILTEDGKFYFSNNQKAKRVSELKPEFKKTSSNKIQVEIAAERGNIIDFLIRRFFENRLTADNINMAAGAYRKLFGKRKLNFDPNFFTDLYKNFETIKSEFDSKGWTIVSNLPTLYGMLGKDLYAGTTDLLAKDKDGNYFIIDLKTSSQSRRNDYESQLLGGSNYGYKTSDRIQQNAYRELLKQRTGIEVKGLYILPIIVEGTIGVISGKFKSSKIDSSPTEGNLLPIDMSKNIYEILPDKFTFPETNVPEFPVSNLIVGKIVYASPGLGKSTLVSQYPNQFADMDQLLADEFNAAGYTGFTADNVGSKVFELYKGQDFDSIDEIVNDIYRKAFDRAREMTKTGVTVLTGSSRFISGRGSNRYVDVAIKADSDTLIKDQMKAKNPTMSESEIDSLVSRVRQTEDKAKILIEVDNAGFLNFIQGNINLSPLIAKANSNKEIMAIEKLISITVSDEDLANFTAKNKLMQDRQKMFKELQPGDLVELSINDGKNTVTLSVERLVPYANGKNNKVMFMPNSNKIKELIPTNSFSIVSVTKAGIKPSEVEVSPEANQNAKDNINKMDDFTSETDRLKKLLEEDFNEDDLFNEAEDPNNCITDLKKPE